MVIPMIVWNELPDKPLDVVLAIMAHPGQLVHQEEMVEMVSMD
jgi:hypothetical protein